MRTITPPPRPYGMGPMRIDSFETARFVGYKLTQPEYVNHAVRLSDRINKMSSLLRETSVVHDILANYKEESRGDLTPTMIQECNILVDVAFDLVDS